MARLRIALFGPLQVWLDGEPVRFESDKVRALLAYLVVESDGPHRREKLAGLLWPGWPDASARNNLRHTLSVLRKDIGDREASRPALYITRQTVQFDASGEAWADVTAFATLLQTARPPEPKAIQQLEKAAGLYRGDFLQDFSLPDSPEFEEWATLSREQFRRQAMDTLRALASELEESGDIERALEHARRQTELDPWREEAHRWIMRLLALSGRRSEALAQYQTCQRLLAGELGVEPSAETVELYQQIRDGELQAVAEPAARPSLPATGPPPFLDDKLEDPERPLFVARKRELAELDRHLEQALTGQGHVVFLVGEAGSGKTALAQEFAHRAQAEHAGLVAAAGQGNAQTGIGDPYLPFREILELLTGDVESQWAAGAMHREQARRLWATLPRAARALAEVGPDLIDTFVLRSSLARRLAVVAPGSDLQARFAEYPGTRLPEAPTASGPQQTDLFEQYTRVLQTLAQKSPLLLVIDDLQWADLGSISLLFHLGRQLSGCPILIVGAYRPEELGGRSHTPGMGTGQEGRHPLESVVHELQRIFGDIRVNLRQAEGREFVDALLDSEPNRLGTAFRAMLYWQTRGHPLFTVELLRGLQEQGDLVQDAGGRWLEGPALDWERLPARVEAVIAERIARLDPASKEILQVACVEGQAFTAEIVARVLDRDERETVRILGGMLDRGHRLVRARALAVAGERRVSRYRFRHSLFQKYLYDNLDQAERAYLHEDIGNVLEAWYGPESGEMAVELARHFDQARITGKAIRYLHQAGDRAVQLPAYEEGVAHLKRALELFATLPAPESDEAGLARAEQELALQISLGMALKSRIPGVEGEQALTRARELCHISGKTDQLSRIVGELSIAPFVRAEYRKAFQLSDEALRLAKQDDDALLITVSRWHLGYILFSMGDYVQARHYLRQVISFYDDQSHHRDLVLVRGSDPGVSALAYDACCLWCLGYPEQAEARCKEALALARKLDHAFTMADVLCFAGCVLHKLRRDAAALRDYGDELARLSMRMNFLSFLGTGQAYRGEGLVRLGQVQEGIAQMREAVASRRSLDTNCYSTGILGGLAWALGRAGDLDSALITLAEAYALVENTGEGYFEPELHRLEGRLRLELGDEAGAESAFLEALAVARRREARSWELRAATSLARLWQKQGKAGDARELLTGIHGWFTEGFDTPDLQEATALLQAL